MTKHADSSRSSRSGRAWLAATLIAAACGTGPGPSKPGGSGPVSAGSASGDSGSGATSAGSASVSGGIDLIEPAPIGGGGAAGSGSAAGSGATAPAQVQAITLADAGLEALSLDRKADPCVDFYQFACGGWLAKHPIPDDRSAWNRFAEIDQQNEAVLRSILDDAAAGKLGATEPVKKIGDYYGACMDDAGIEKKGRKAIQPMLTKAGKVRDAKSWFAMLLDLHKVGDDAVWQISAQPDFVNSSMNALWMDAGGLTLPDRDYYVEASFKDKLDAYRAHLVRMFGLLGRKPAAAAAAADDVLRIETELAKVTKTGVEARVIKDMYNPKTLAELKGLTASVDWQAYFKGLGIAAPGTVIVGTPKFFQALDALRKAQKPTAWQAYFTYRVIAGNAFAVGKRFDDEMFALRQALTGVKAPRERYKRCIDGVDGALPEYLGPAFVERSFPGSSKTAANALVDALFTSMEAQIGKLDWMSAATQAAAKAKLGKLERLIGYPDAWKTYGFAVKRDDFLGNRQRAAAFETKRQLDKVGKAVQRDEWLMGAYEVNAYYNPSTNNTALPAGILQPPFFGPSRSIAANLGGIGMVIGHELTHGFDDQGAEFDGEGNRADWWAPVDKTAFASKGQCVSKQYSSFEVLPGKFINGDLTLGENIADLGGVKMAFYAYRALRAGAVPTVADGFTEDQQYFLGVGQAWCAKYTKDEQISRLTTDVHSPPKFRVYGALRNLPEFAAAWNCAAGTPMNPSNRCTVW